MSCTTIIISLFEGEVGVCRELLLSVPVDNVKVEAVVLGSDAAVSDDMGNLELSEEAPVELMDIEATLADETDMSISRFSDSPRFIKLDRIAETEESESMEAIPLLLALSSVLALSGATT